MSRVPNHFPLASGSSAFLAMKASISANPSFAPAFSACTVSSGRASRRKVLPGPTPEACEVLPKCVFSLPRFLEQVHDEVQVERRSARRTARPRPTPGSRAWPRPPGRSHPGKRSAAQACIGPGWLLTFSRSSGPNNCVRVTLKITSVSDRITSVMPSGFSPSQPGPASR